MPRTFGRGFRAARVPAGYDGAHGRGTRAKESVTGMSERPSFWQRLFGRDGGSSLSARQQRVLQYIIERMDKSGAPLQEVLREDYVRRNCSQEEVRQIVNDPAFVQAARERLGESFRSEEFRI